MITLFGRCEAGHAFPVEMDATTTFLLRRLTVDQVRRACENFLRSMDYKKPPCPLCGGVVEFMIIERDAATA